MSTLAGWLMEDTSGSLSKPSSARRTRQKKVCLEGFGWTGVVHLDKYEMHGANPEGNLASWSSCGSDHRGEFCFFRGVQVCKASHLVGPDLPRISRTISIKSADDGLK